MASHSGPKHLASRPRARPTREAVDEDLEEPTLASCADHWETTERVLESGAFESKQRTLVPTAVVENSESGARWLGVTYWQAVGEFSRGSVALAGRKLAVGSLCWEA